MIKYLLVITTIIFCSRAAAQDCSKELLRNKPGVWKAGPQGAVSNISATELAKEKAVIASLHKMISTRYNPTGCQVSYSTVFGKHPDAGQNFIADPYHYALYILRYICDANSKDKTKYYTDYSTPTTVNISINEISSLNTLYAANIAPDDFRGYLKLKVKPQKKGDYYYMGEEIAGDRGTPTEITESCWLITYTDTLPFSYLTRKDYLLIQKKRLEQSLKDNPGDKEYTNKFIANVNEYLKKPEAELDKPAICMWNEEERFVKFAEEGSSGSFFAIRPNLAYYHKKLPASAPQFITVVYKMSKGDAVFEDNIAALKKAIDFTALKNMLGK